MENEFWDVGKGVLGLKLVGLREKVLVMGAEEVTRRWRWDDGCVVYL